jgi:hypothetical protein
MLRRISLTMAGVGLLLALVSGGFWLWQIRTILPPLSATDPSAAHPSEPVVEMEPPPGPALAGRWEIQLGKAVDTLDLTETSGVLTGQLTKDLLWGGETIPVDGARFGETIELSYRWEMKTVGTESSSDYRFVGKLESPSTLGGTVTIRTFASNGQIVKREMHWRGERPVR